jgi:hypothetical protein
MFVRLRTEFSPSETREAAYGKLSLEIPLGQQVLREQPRRSCSACSCQLKGACGLPRAADLLPFAIDRLLSRCAMRALCLVPYTTLDGNGTSDSKKGQYTNVRSIELTATFTTLLPNTKRDDQKPTLILRKGSPPLVPVPLGGGAIIGIFAWP